MLSLVNSHKEHCLSTAPGSASWFSITWTCKACGVRKFTEQNGHWLTCIFVCTLSLVIVLNSLLQSLHLITLSLCSPKCCKYSEYWLNGCVQNGQAKIVCSPECSWLIWSVSFLPVWYTLPQYLHSAVSAGQRYLLLLCQGCVYWVHSLVLPTPFLAFLFSALPLIIWPSMLFYTCNDSSQLSIRDIKIPTSLFCWVYYC